ncbi:MAG: hypothetical protein AAF696_01175, partial [Bacteroidota bacterium]
LFLVSLAFIIVAFFSWKNLNQKPKKFVGDALFFTLMGLAGCLLLFLWIGTDHSATKQNWNLLWLLPTHLIAGLFLFRKEIPQWLKTYMGINTIIITLVLLGWFIIPQSFHIAFIPLMLISGLRSGLIYRKTKA